MFGVVDESIVYKRIWLVSLMHSIDTTFKHILAMKRESIEKEGMTRHEHHVVSQGRFNKLG